MKSELTYEIRDRVGEISDFRLGGSALSVKIPDCMAGHLILGGFSVPLTEGEAALDCSLIPDGEYRPLLITRGRQIVLERFAVEGGKLALLPTEEATIRELLRRTRQLERGLHALEKWALELEKKISSDTIF